MELPALQPLCSLRDAKACFAQWQTAAQAAGICLKPPPPAPTSCCGRGCNGCVWEGFFAAATYWQETAYERLATPKPSATAAPAAHSTQS